MNINITWLILKAAVVVTLIGGIVGWLMWRSLRRTDDPVRLLVKWLATLAIVGLLFASARAIGWSPVLPGIAAAFGLALTILWGRDIGELFARPFTSMMDGGDTEPDPVPVYSTAEARRKQGRWEEAVAEVEKQLERFPGDFRGWMLLAEIQAENRRDLEAAAGAVEQVVSDPARDPRNVAFALNRLADWQLSLGRDAEAARATLARICDLLPETEQAIVAGRRMAHLEGRDVGEGAEPKVIALRRFNDRLGLREGGAVSDPDAETADLAARTSALVARLGENPGDVDAREALVRCYAEGYRRIDLAEGQIEEIIRMPSQPARVVVQWLNRLADYHMKLGGDVERARAVLRRIEESYPDTAAAENARHRLAHLNLEAKGLEEGRVVRLGTYQQRLGLK